MLYLYHAKKNHPKLRCPQCGCAWVRITGFARVTIHYDAKNRADVICAREELVRLGHPPDVVDLGLRLGRRQAEGLAAEPCTFHESRPSTNLRQNGATAAEVAFLLTNGGQRVELNALASDHFVTWLEAKLAAAGVVKVIPNDETLATAYQRATYVLAIVTEFEKIHQTAQALAAATVPPVDLRRAVARRIEMDSTLTWDAAVAQIADSQTNRDQNHACKEQP